MRLMLLRHAKAEKALPGMRDRDRALAARGRKDAARLGAYLIHHGLVPDQVLVSPARRTRETWEELEPVLSPAAAATYDERLYEGGPEAVLAVAKAADPSAHTLLVVGHNPVLHDVARLLVASGDVMLREQLNEGLPTTGLVVIGFAGDDWQTLHPRGGRLERLVTPGSLISAPD
jgi:phosphohistidine phosphatase